jgi:hypothetical protein
MFSECANPECRAEFDYRQGKFFRFRKPQRKDGQPANTHSVQHFWLCGSCARIYRLEYEPGRGILLRPVQENVMQPGLPLLVAAA